ncbi:hypothetical protein SUGI_0852120 [Cryptomeria japonica]|nr:hypothetical protein SUGI_0852120 [Cryptomeria japonica]
MPSPLEATVSEVVLPVVDISKFPRDFDAQELNHLLYHPELAKIREACKEWGFFQLVNHGIPIDLLQKAENGSRSLLSMPNEIKDKASSGKPLDTYYRKGNYESFHLRDSTSPGSFEQMYEKLRPQGNPNLCEAMAKYASCVSDLAQKITKAILASLGLDAQVYYHNYFENCRKVMRINGYSLENMSIEEEALLAHTDSGFLTILYQDDVGGLQIRSREGEWFNVKPLSHSFVVNLGDSFKAWTNGLYRSAEHRVVCKSCRDRMSIAFFTSFPAETEIWAPEELVDKKNPRLYKPFIFSDFMRYIMSNREDNGKTTALERFASI